MSPPNFASETMQVFNVYDFALFASPAWSCSAAVTASGPAKRPPKRAAPVTIFRIFILFLLIQLHPYYAAGARTPRNFFNKCFAWGGAPAGAGWEVPVQFIPLAPPLLLPVLQQRSFGAPQVVHL